MTPCEKRVCCEITEAYKPWVKDGGVKWLFRDAYTRVGGRWAIWSKKDMDAIKCSRMRAVEAARKGTRTHPPAGCDHRQRIFRSSKTYYGPHDGRAVAVNETISYDDTELIGLALSMMVATSAAVCGVIMEHTTASSATKAGSASILYGDKT
ncbi:hypothetical protein CC77DRAFT_1009566 [Alternaria alternata]|uniref:Uncharacterized protein n=1 Tax=Alternaria alternata TaxID=5599 RepID=A0A177DM33_ALTAL|nr:hypothetical protein CC77DRAFT_1009566 [Alternaria alternata]OAG19869.1 hypothetical protein CC77DRAFT_1009566 [Alternaria alternata]